MHRVWTTERLEKLQKLRADGQSYAQIAATMGCSAASVSFAASRYGLTSGAAGRRGWHGDPEGHARAGSKGGKVASQDREHMAHIGRLGGQKVARNRDYMAELGRKGAATRARLRSERDSA